MNNLQVSNLRNEASGVFTFTLSLIHISLDQSFADYFDISNKIILRILIMKHMLVLSTKGYEAVKWVMTLNH